MTTCPAARLTQGLVAALRTTAHAADFLIFLLGVASHPGCGAKTREARHAALVVPRTPDAPDASVWPIGPIGPIAPCAAGQVPRTCGVARAHARSRSCLTPQPGGAAKNCSPGGKSNHRLGSNRQEITDAGRQPTAGAGELTTGGRKHAGSQGKRACRPQGESWVQPRPRRRFRRRRWQTDAALPARHRRVGSGQKDRQRAG